MLISARKALNRRNKSKEMMKLIAFQEYMHFTEEHILLHHYAGQYIMDV
jgi:hypothetical protein